MQSRVKLNLFAISCHIVLVLSYAVISFYNENVFSLANNLKRENRVETAYWFFSGLIDICLSLVVWVITDDETNPNFIKDDRVQISYPVLDVLRDQLEQDTNDIFEACMTEREIFSEDSNFGSQAVMIEKDLSVSDRLIFQFLASADEYLNSLAPSED
jgi:hypothetical protein